MKKKIILCLICLLTLAGCGKIPTLKNGEEAVVTFEKDGKKHQISVDELYENLKEDFGLQATIKLIDDYILETEFKDYVNTAKENAENLIKSAIASYGSEQLFLNALQSSGYSSKEAYQDYIYTNLMQSHALEEYAKLQVTDKEIEKYYNDEAKGDVEVYHILITSKAQDSMTADEKTKEENNAKDKLKELLEEIKNSDDKEAKFKELAKANSEDESTKDKEGYLGFINYNQLGKEYDKLLDTAYDLKDGEYSKDIITTELGYHIIYRKSIKEKESLDKLKDKIIETLADRKIEEDTNIEVDSLEYYRKLYNLKIIDSTLNRQYGIYLNNLRNKDLTNQNN